MVPPAAQAVAVSLRRGILSLKNNFEHHLSSSYFQSPQELPEFATLSQYFVPELCSVSTQYLDLKDASQASFWIRYARPRFRPADTLLRVDLQVLTTPKQFSLSQHQHLQRATMIPFHTISSSPATTVSPSLSTSLTTAMIYTSPSSALMAAPGLHLAWGQTKWRAR